MKKNTFIILSNAETYLSSLSVTIKYGEPEFMKEHAIATTERDEHYEAYRSRLASDLAQLKKYMRELRAHLSKLNE